MLLFVWEIAGGGRLSVCTLDSKNLSNVNTPFICSLLLDTDSGVHQRLARPGNDYAWQRFPSRQADPVPSNLGPVSTPKAPPSAEWPSIVGARFPVLIGGLDETSSPLGVCLQLSSSHLRLPAHVKELRNAIRFSLFFPNGNEDNWNKSRHF